MFPSNTSNDTLLKQDIFQKIFFWLIVFTSLWTMLLVSSPVLDSSLPVSVFSAWDTDLSLLISSSLHCCWGWVQWPPACWRQQESELSDCRWDPEHWGVWDHREPGGTAGRSCGTNKLPLKRKILFYLFMSINILLKYLKFFSWLKLEGMDLIVLNERLMCSSLVMCPMLSGISVILFLDKFRFFIILKFPILGGRDVILLKERSRFLKFFSTFKLRFYYKAKFHWRSLLYLE